MSKLANYLLFQLAWLPCVLGAARGQLWLGPLAVALALAVHLVFIAQPSRRARELGYVLLVGALGTLADAGLAALGATSYPSSEAAWSLALPPPWITALWVLFGTLPHHSLGWLRGRPLLAALLGAVGGPLSYLAGARLGAVAIAEEPLLTFGALALEYAVAMPLMLWLAREPVPAVPILAVKEL